MRHFRAECLKDKHSTPNFKGKTFLAKTCYVSNFWYFFNQSRSCHAFNTSIVVACNSL